MSPVIIQEIASLSHNELFLTPRQTPVQRCMEHTLTLSPTSPLPACAPWDCRRGM
ncbi:transglutaminase N-terminal domain-containing protein [Desulfotignum balticum]|uniref:transglutaminase N-terminal domain-containing protein n=1 Tax=Desulfotignum balticum TaxID=115781 RepID=UPI0012EB47D1|nr:transglutaminase N-terminal domain-containing protein [Desulfotignum balticum]